MPKECDIMIEYANHNVSIHKHGVNYMKQNKPISTSVSTNDYIPFGPILALPNFLNKITRIVLVSILIHVLANKHLVSCKRTSKFCVHS